MNAVLPKRARRGLERREGFTLGECLIAIAVMAICATLVLEVSSTIFASRQKLEARFEAEQATTNVLEEARAMPWEELTPDWANARKLPPELLRRWPQAKLVVRIEPEANRPKVKRAVVEVQWPGSDFTSWPTVTATALFAARSAEGGK